MTARKLITVVIPCYNEAENIERTYGAIKSVLARLAAYDHEIIFIDNVSRFLVIYYLPLAFFSNQPRTRFTNSSSI